MCFFVLKNVINSIAFELKGNHGLNFVAPMFSVPGFSISALTLDCMHVLDLGVIF